MIPPNDVRFFVHKRLIRAASGFVTSGFNPLAAAGGFIAPVSRSRGRGTVAKNAKFRQEGSFVPQIRRPARPLTTASAFPRSLASVSPSALQNLVRTKDWDVIARMFGTSVAAVQARARGIIEPASGPCNWPKRKDPITGQCRIFLGDKPGADDEFTPIEDMNGVHPASPPGHVHPVSPIVDTRTHLRCPAGYVLGRNNNCYWNLPRNSKWRKWRPGRKPAFTGGDLNAIARAGKLADVSEDLFKKTNPAKKAVAKNYRANWRKPLKK